MLRRFLYLDVTAVRQYASMVDGGLADTSVETRSTDRTTGGGVDVKVATGKHERGSHEEGSRTLTDTDEARFDRLVTAAAADFEALGWVDVLQPDLDLQDVGVGALVKWECDVWVPTISQALAKGGEFSSAIDLVRELLPVAEQLGLDTKKLPPATQLDAIGQFTKTVKPKLAVIGDDVDTSWSITGTLDSEHIDGELDGRVVVVGKVRKVVREGQWQPLLTLPGMNFGSREERRKRERQQPKTGQEDNYVAGPALVLDILAIYV